MCHILRFIVLDGVQKRQEKGKLVPIFVVTTPQEFSCPNLILKLRSRVCASSLPKLHCQCPIIGQIIQWPWSHLLATWQHHYRVLVFPWGLIWHCQWTTPSTGTSRLKGLHTETWTLWANLLMGQKTVIFHFHLVTNWYSSIFTGISFLHSGHLKRWQRHHTF